MLADAGDGVLAALLQEPAFLALPPRCIVAVLDPLPDAGLWMVPQEVPPVQQLLLQIILRVHESEQRTAAEDRRRYELARMLAIDPEPSKDVECAAAALRCPRQVGAAAEPRSRCWSSRPTAGPCWRRCSPRATRGAQHAAASAAGAAGSSRLLRLRDTIDAVQATRPPPPRVSSCCLAFFFFFFFVVVVVVVVVVAAAAGPVRREGVRGAPPGAAAIVSAGVRREVLPRGPERGRVSGRGRARPHAARRVRRLGRRLRPCRGA